LAELWDELLLKERLELLQGTEADVRRNNATMTFSSRGVEDLFVNSQKSSFDASITAAASSPIPPPPSSSFSIDKQFKCEFKRQSLKKCWRKLFIECGRSALVFVIYTPCSYL
jgi:hypothetical protein